MRRAGKKGGKVMDGWVGVGRKEKGGKEQG